MHTHICVYVKEMFVPVLNWLSTTPWRRMGEWMYRSTFSWHRHWLKVSRQLHAPAALSPRKKPPVPIGYEAGWTPEPVWTVWRSENSWPHRDSNSDLSVVQPVASRYTDYAIPAPSPNIIRTIKSRIGWTAHATRTEEQVWEGDRQ
jgi:hypothetical protein